MQNKILKYINSLSLEIFIWIIALIYLWYINPFETQHYSFCLFNNLGFDFCPGCGIGRSISMIFHGEFLESLKMHPLGFFAFVTISYRIYYLFRNNKNYSIIKRIKWQA